MGGAGSRIREARRWAGAPAVVRGAGVIHPIALIALLAFVRAFPWVRRVMGKAAGRDLVPVLSGTGRFELVYAALLALGVGAAQHLG